MSEPAPPFYAPAEVVAPWVYGHMRGHLIGIVMQAGYEPADFALLVGPSWEELPAARQAELVEGSRQSMASYVDASKPERECEYCGRLYRGPAVYCSLQCALADAE